MTAHKIDLSLSKFSYKHGELNWECEKDKWRIKRYHFGKPLAATIITRQSKAGKNKHLEDNNKIVLFHKI